MQVLNDTIMDLPVVCGERVLEGSEGRYGTYFIPSLQYRISAQYM